MPHTSVALGVATSQVLEVAARGSLAQKPNKRKGAKFQGKKTGLPWQCPLKLAVVALMEVRSHAASHTPVGNGVMAARGILTYRGGRVNNAGQRKGPS